MSALLVGALLLWTPLAGAREEGAARPVSADADEQPPTAASPGAPQGPGKHKAKAKTKAKKSGKQSEPAPAKAATRTAGGESDEEGMRFGLEAEARLGAGASTGRTIHRDPAFLNVVGARLQPLLHWGVLELRSDVELEHEESWGAALRESSASVSGEAELRPWRELRVAAELGGLGLVRPGWPDPYQPLGGDPALGLAPTDRGSHLDIWAQARALWTPAPRNFLRARYRFTRTDSVDDPAFDAVARPNHLTPFDNDEHAAELSWRGALGHLRPALAVGAARTDWFFVFSRDAHTGLTHVGEGGDPPNPLLAENALDLEPELELELGDPGLELKLAWRLRLVQDPWQGYQSRTEQRLRLEAQWLLGPRELQLELEGKLGVEQRLYADTSYAAGPDHPPLDWGERRESRAARLALSARFPRRQPLCAFLELEGSTYLTNFPDYVPGVYPASQAYDVKRDWQHARALLGVELALDR